MLVSGSSPLAVARETMWGFLMFAGAAWLVIGWAVMRLEPAEIGAVAGPVILFGAVCELVRTLAGTKTWWLNAGLTMVFGLTAAAMMFAPDSPLSTPAGLVGWYLLVRGAVDVAVGIMTRGSDRVWSLIVTVGVLETGLGYFSAGPFAQATDLIVVTLGALAVLRAVADLVTALRLREIAPAVRKDVLDLPPERADGLAGYSAGHADYDAGPARAKHRAQDGATHRAQDVPAVTPTGGTPHAPGASYHEHVVRTTADLDAMLIQAGINGPRAGSRPPEAGDLPPVPDTPGAVADTEITSAGRARDDRAG